MAPTPYRIAQTSNEAKKQYKKNGPRLPDRQQKQLERAHELDTRAARMREAEERRKAAKKKREEREQKEKLARQQNGVGLATQLIGYSHTQAQLKHGMESFLGLKQHKDEERRKRDLELANKLEQLAQTVDKEPWDDDGLDDFALLSSSPVRAASGEQFLDQDLDDDTLLEVHDMAVSDPPEGTVPIAKPVDMPVATKESGDFLRLHGPVNKAIENILDQLPGPLVELLSQDLSLRRPDWDPAPGLLHKLNPLGLPPHRLRVKVGSVVTLLRELNTSSQLSRSQHLRILRAEHDRLECLVLDGQLEGTKAFLTRIAFPARYRNDAAYPFQRIQFPIRITADWSEPMKPPQTSRTELKPPPLSIQTPSSLPRKTNSVTLQVGAKADFKLPGLPASRSGPSNTLDAVRHHPVTKTAVAVMTDCWDDFLESGTQIARELCAETVLPAASSKAQSIQAPPVAADEPSIISTQDFDFDFSMEELEKSSKPVKAAQSVRGGHGRGATKAQVQVSRDWSSLRPSQKPPSVSDRPGLKRKGLSSGPKLQHTLQHAAKRQRVQGPEHTSRQGRQGVSKTIVVEEPCSTFSDMGISTQEAASFFDDDDEVHFGSPPIAV